MPASPIAGDSNPKGIQLLVSRLAITNEPRRSEMIAQDDGRDGSIHLLDDTLLQLGTQIDVEQLVRVGGS